MQKATILTIGVHPDDIEFSCGGTIIKYTQRDHRLFLHIMTEVGLGANTATRTSEQEASRAVLGAEDIFWGDYEDTHLQVDVELIGKIEEVLAKSAQILGKIPKDISEDNIRSNKQHLSAIKQLKAIVEAEHQKGANIIDIKATMGLPDISSLMRSIQKCSSKRVI